MEKNGRESAHGSGSTDISSPSEIQEDSTQTQESNLDRQTQKKQQGIYMEPNMKVLLRIKEKIRDVTEKSNYKTKEIVAIKIGNLNPFFQHQVNYIFFLSYQYNYN